VDEQLVQRGRPTRNNDTNKKEKSKVVQINPAEFEEG
jgi:hypothetical protein